MAPRTVTEMQRFLTGSYPQLIAAIGEASRSVDGWFTARDIAGLLPSSSGGAEKIQSELQSLVPTLGLETETEDGELRFRFADDSLPIYLWLLIARDRLNSGKLDPAAPTPATGKASAGLSEVKS